MMDSTPVGDVEINVTELTTKYLTESENSGDESDTIPIRDRFIELFMGSVTFHLLNTIQVKDMLPAIVTSFVGAEAGLIVR
jgi:hypothetical protein